MVSPEQTASGRILSGYTIIYPGCRTRGHSHADREEVYYFIKGSGIMVVDDEEMASDSRRYALSQAGTVPRHDQHHGLPVRVLLDHDQG